MGQYGCLDKSIGRQFARCFVLIDAVWVLALIKLVASEIVSEDPRA